MLPCQVKYILPVCVHNASVWQRLQSVLEDNSNWLKRQSSKF